MDFFKQLLPDPVNLHLQGWAIDSETAHLTLTVSSTQSQATCPLCQRSSSRIHSHYDRTLQDLSCANYRLTLHLQVRKFFCIHSDCNRRIFTERLPKVTVPWARSTQRFIDQISAIGLALGGSAGKRLSQKLGYRFSRNTLIQRVMRLPLPQSGLPRILGVDDFAFRRGQRYGTILVDLERHCPIAMLEDREANTLAEWLKAHPGIEVLSRDRSKTYKQGMTQGAPEAIQVADRFHLLQNLSEVLERYFAGHQALLKAIEKQYYQQQQARASVARQPTALQAQRNEQRRAQFKKVHRLRSQGYAVLDIAHHLGMGERTVARYVATPTFPEWQPQKRQCWSQLDKYKPELLQQWNRGQRSTKELYKLIQQQGYQGSYPTVARYTHQLKQQQRSQLSQEEGRGACPTDLKDRQPPLSARRATWLVLRPAKQLNSEDQQWLERLRQHSALSGTIGLAENFATLVRERQGDQFDAWLKSAVESSAVVFQRFAKSLQEDYEAVKAGMTLSVSNGQVEGQINRLKMIKRQMYGRAGFELLRRRVLSAS